MFQKFLFISLLLLTLFQIQGSVRSAEMGKIFRPTDSPEDWQVRLASPDKQWKTGYSAKTLAYCWEDQNNFPKSVKKVFNNSNLKLFKDMEMLLGIPEYKVPLPGGIRPSQSDLFVLAKSNLLNQTVVIMVEGKVSESFGKKVDEWIKDNSPGKQKRLKFLLRKLQIPYSEQIFSTRYQLLHRTVSAVITAEKFGVENALMLVHSFNKGKEGEAPLFADYCRFLQLFGVKGKINSVIFARNLKGINLYVGWVEGNEKYLDK